MLKMKNIDFAPLRPMFAGVVGCPDNPHHLLADIRAHCTDESGQPALAPYRLESVRRIQLHIAEFAARHNEITAKENTLHENLGVFKAIKKRNFLDEQTITKFTTDLADCGRRKSEDKSRSMEYHKAFNALVAKKAENPAYYRLDSGWEFEGVFYRRKEDEEILVTIKRMIASGEIEAIDVPEVDIP